MEGPRFVFLFILMAVISGFLLGSWVFPQPRLKIETVKVLITEYEQRCRDRGGRTTYYTGDMGEVKYWSCTLTEIDITKEIMGTTTEVVPNN